MDATLIELLKPKIRLAYELGRLDPEGRAIAAGYVERLMECEDVDRADMLLQMMEAELCAYLERQLAELGIGAP